MDKCPRPCFDGILITKCEFDLGTFIETREFGFCPICNPNDVKNLVNNTRYDWLLENARNYNGFLQ